MFTAVKAALVLAQCIFVLFCCRLILLSIQSAYRVDPFARIYNLWHICCLSNVNLYDENAVFKHNWSENSIAVYHIYFLPTSAPAH